MRLQGQIRGTRYHHCKSQDCFLTAHLLIPFSDAHAHWSPPTLATITDSLLSDLPSSGLTFHRTYILSDSFDYLRYAPLRALRPVFVLGLFKPNKPLSMNVRPGLLSQRCCSPFRRGKLVDTPRGSLLRVRTAEAIGG